MAIKTLNSVYIKEKDYEYINKYYNILVCQNLRAKF